MLVKYIKEISNKKILFITSTEQAALKYGIDIEKEYYNLLSLDFESSDNESIAKLNNELAFLKSQLIAYLNNIEKEFINDSIVKGSIKAKMLEPINPRDISVRAKIKVDAFKHSRLMQYNDTQWNILLNKYGYKEPFDIINAKDKSSYKEIYLPNSILLLNFNYTRTADLYLRIWTMPRISPSGVQRQ